MKKPVRLLLLILAAALLASLFACSKSGNALSAADAKKAKKLIDTALKSSPVADFDNSAVAAKDDDPDITVWFNHSYVNTPAEDTKPTGFASYRILLAGNEIEGCHFMVASKTGKSGVSLSVSEFRDAAGNTLPHEVCYGWYFDDVDGKTVADPIPVLEHEFDLKAGMSQMFVIKVKSAQDQPSGMYSAVVTLTDNAGRELKKANVFAYVWDFSLPVASSCKTLSDLNEWAVIVGANRESTTTDGLEDDLYALYYEYLLENKINCYTLPYAKRGQFWDDRVDKYLDDPRCTCFTLFWKIACKNSSEIPDYLKAAYDRLSAKPGRLEKAYFYPDACDEPLDISTLDLVKYYNAEYTKVFGAHKLLIPVHYDTLIDQSTDFFKYLENDVTAWCPKTYFFNTSADKKADPALYTDFYDKSMEETLGVFKDRMAAEQEGGDEVWWYVTRYPHDPEITLSINDEAIKHRILFWQQKLYNVDGFLYYMVNDWEDSKNWTKKYEQYASGTLVNTYGNGVLIYPGGALPEYVGKYGSDGYPGPIGSLRLEDVRDGIEDYDYFTLLDSLYGEGTSTLIIKQVTQSLGEYSTDTELFAKMRLVLGNLIAAKA
ncbi:MAG: DUF4091 domain-containing protein [Clostridia bacterium]|nr:DUF4091 domain-containing protein [Clostridia bacterium]